MKRTPLHAPVGPKFGTGGVSIVDGTHAPDWRMDWTISPNQKILLIVSGSGFIEDGQCTWPLRAGLLVYVPNNWRYRVVDKELDPMTLFVLFLHEQVFGSHTDLGFEKRPMFFSKGSFAQSSGDRMREIFFEQSAELPGCQAILRGMAWRFIGEIVRARARSLPDGVPVDPAGSIEARVQHFIAELNDSFFQPVSLESVSERMVMSKRSLTAAFRRLTGTSFLQYVRNLRIEHAKMLLRETNRSVITISFECGFDNLSHFYRIFKTTTGYAPEHWRRAIRAKRI
jgi:AraC-like DNA-binding protein